MRALLASPLGLLIGLSLGALGGGGSVLAVPVLVYAAGQDPQQATTTSLLIVGSASIIGMIGHWRGGRVRVGTGLAFGAAGIGGSLLGTAVNRQLDPDVLLLGFSVLVVVAAWRMLTRCPTCTVVGEEEAIEAALAPTGVDGSGPGGATTSAPGGGGTVVATARTGVRARLDLRMVVLVLLAGTAVGFLTGLFGVGGGFVIVPALALLLKLPMPEAIGTSLLVIAVNSAVALVPRLAIGGIDWAVTMPFAASAIVGVIIGARIADRLHPERSLRAFAGLLIAVALWTGGQAIVALV